MATLILVSAFLTVVWQGVSLPAATLLGPMLAGMVFAFCGVKLTVPRWAFTGAQSVVGCMVALTMSPAILSTLFQSWPAILFAIALVILFGALVGHGLMRFGSLPGNTAAWGTSPGGAVAMVAMAESFGADIRMVAFMQYLRIFVVVLTASGVSSLLLGGPAADLPVRTWSPGFDAPLIPLIQTLALVAVGVLVGRMGRIPAGALLMPMIFGAVLNCLGFIHITLPPWLLWAAYASLGWYIGLRFTPETLRHTLRVLPQLLLAVVALMVLCCMAAWMLTVWAGVDPLTAYLATSPGGLDSVAIIAADSGCDLAFVLSLQSLRLFAVVLTGPLVARLICRINGRSSCGMA
ncbi:AbrB family transcriptional regulator [Desulfobotulus sp. H1]|uniref:AbrB family transcriptional regulator n=1 Tax=Desulfobotulus pelophilus TaxID=2823377 RepID=A0ABT3NB85_9BACT|nr:AbrB family transcriptional regulator [Desulfobotulus pelophilus]MCW7754232.1 AbrB family transcriptional regulator [Desulfobotulus pelophilus]